MRIAIVRLSAMGDIIQSMVVLELIKRSHPKTSIDWYVDKRFEGLLEGNSNIDQIHYLSFKNIKGLSAPLELFKLYQKLQKINEYDLIIDFQGLIKSSIISRFLKSKIRYGFDYRSCKEGVASYLYSHRLSIPYSVNVISRYVALIEKALNVKIRTDELNNKESIFKYKKLKNQDYVVFILGASFKSKIYSVEKFSEVAKKINKKIYALWHTSQERESAIELKNFVKNVQPVNTKNLIELKELIGNAKLVIGGDTGPTHLAWAMNIPSITIFGSTSMSRNFFKTKLNLGIDSDLIINSKKINKKESSINNINPKQIINLVKILEKRINTKFT